MTRKWSVASSTTSTVSCAQKTQRRSGIGVAWAVDDVIQTILRGYWLELVRAISPNRLRSRPPVGRVGCHGGRSVGGGVAALGIAPRWRAGGATSALFAGAGDCWSTGAKFGQGTGRASENGHGFETRNTRIASGMQSRKTMIAVHCACFNPLMPRKGVVGSVARKKKTTNWLMA